VRARPFDRRPTDQGSERCARGGAVARPERRDTLGHQARELVRDRRVHEGAVDADARLPGVAQGRGDDAARRQRQVGVGKHQERRVAAEL